MKKKFLAILYLVIIVFLALFSLADIYCGMKNNKEYKKQKVVLVSYPQITKTIHYESLRTPPTLKYPLFTYII